MLEDDGGHGGYGAYDIMMSAGDITPYGVHYGSSEDLYKTFVKPFVDVVQTAAGKGKEMSVRTQALVKTSFETILTTILPIVRDDYAIIFDKERKEIQRIRQEYADVYQSNWDALLNDDILVAAFFYQPAALFTVAAAKRAPSVLLSIASVLSGGELDDWLARVKEKAHEKKHGHRKDHGRTVGHRETFGAGRPRRHKKGELGGMGAGIDYYEGLVRESDDIGAGEFDVAKALSSKKLKARLEACQVTQKMEASARAVVHEALKDAFRQIQGIMSARSLKELEQMLSKKLTGLDKLSQVEPGARENVERSILAGTKKSAKEFYVKNLEAQVKHAIDAGVPEDGAYVRAFKAVIAKIKAL